MGNIKEEKLINNCELVSKKTNYFTIEFLFILILGLSALRPFYNYGGVILWFFIFARAGLAGLLMIKYRQKIKLLVWILYACLALMFAFSYFTHFSGLSILLNALSLIASMIVMPFVLKNNDYSKLIFYYFTAYIVMLVIFSTFFNDYWLGEDVVYYGIYINPNTTGFYLMMYSAILLKKLFETQVKQQRIIIIASYIVLFVIALFFSSRTSLLATLIILALLLFKKTKHGNIMDNKMHFIVLLLCVASLVFAYMYSTVLFNWLKGSDITIFGKSLFTGRQYIWSESFEQMFDNWLFGIGNNLAPYASKPEETSVSVHNMVLGIGTYFGVVSMVIFIALFFFIFKFNSGKTSFIYKAFWIAGLFTAFFEVQLYGSTTMPGFILAILYLNYSNKNAVSEVEGEVNESIES